MFFRQHTTTKVRIHWKKELFQLSFLSPYKHSKKELFYTFFRITGYLFYFFSQWMEVSFVVKKNSIANLVNHRIDTVVRQKSFGSRLCWG